MDFATKAYVDAPEPAPATPERLSKEASVFDELSVAAGQMARTSDALIAARREHDMAAARYGEALNNVAKVREQANV